MNISNSEGSLAIDIQKTLKSKQYTSNRRIRDLTYLKTYTIDDNDSLEIDDAISIEHAENKSKLWIHISSPTEFIELNSKIDLYARNRASTLYMPDTTDYMYPAKLVKEVFSLEPQRTSHTLSIGVILNNKGGISEFEVTRSIIKVSYKLSYNDVDELLDYSPREEADLTEIKDLLSLSLNYRIANGAINIEEPKGKFIVRDNLIEHQVVELSPSRRLVAEAMILFGSCMATFCKQNNIIVPYRVQAKPTDKPKIIEDYSYDIHLINFLYKQSLSKSYISLESKPHYSLGLKMYVHATSPIRRYIDIIVHYQVISYLTNHKCLISNDLMLTIIEQYDSRIKQQISITRNALLSNTILWFMQEKLNSWESLFLRWLNKSKGLALLYIKDLEIDLVSKICNNSEIKFGTKLQLSKPTETDNVIQFVVL